MNVQIIDDDNLQIDLLKGMLQKHPDVEQISATCSSHKGVQMVIEEKPDLVFLDINMPGLSGIEVAKRFEEAHISPQVIFTTSYENYAVKAFELDACDYLVKPYSKDRLFQSVEKANRNITLENGLNDIDVKITAHDAGSIILLDSEDIYYFEALSKKVFIYTKRRRYETNETLNALQEKLNDGFFRCHKSYLVNYKKISKLEPLFNRTYIAQFTDMPRKVYVSRKFAKELINLLEL